jgi:hypothetical protein
MFVFGQRRRFPADRGDLRGDGGMVAALRRLPPLHTIYRVIEI